MKKYKKKRRQNLLKASRKRRRPRRSDPLGHLADDRRQAPILQDPIFLHHVASAIVRFLELEHPVETDIARAIESTRIDIEFPDKGEPSE